MKQSQGPNAQGFKDKSFKTKGQWPLVMNKWSEMIYQTKGQGQNCVTYKGQGQCPNNKKPRHVSTGERFPHLVSLSGTGKYVQ